MRTDYILIDNQSRGFDKAIGEAKKVAAYRGLGGKDAIQLQIIAEEMLSLARSVTGGMEATFWIEAEGSEYEFHMTTTTAMNEEKRSMLISAATSRKNEAAKGLLGKLRDAFEEAMAAPFDHSGGDIPQDVINDIVYRSIEDPEWDGYERSVLHGLADEVKIGIRGRAVEMVVVKHLAA